MKKVIFLFALVMFLKPVLPVVEYVVNYEYISKVLCVNKSKPMMHCNGKCHLMKELAKASDPEASGEKPISDKKIAAHEFEVLYFEKIKPFKLAPIYNVTTHKISNDYSNLYFYESSCAVFHPPTFIS